MRLARVEDVGFATKLDRGWVLLADLGIRTTGEAIDRVAEIERRLLMTDEFLDDNVGFDCPSVAPGKIIAIGLNYMDHVQETGAAVPSAPVVFTKFSSALAGPTDPIELDSAATAEADYETELAVVVGTRVRNASESESIRAVFGYCVANDVSAQDIHARIRE